MHLSVVSLLSQLKRKSIMILLSCIFRHRIKKEVELILGTVFTRLFSTLKEIVTKKCIVI
jgi:hypothetical protein